MDDLISRQAALYAIYEICNEPVAWLFRAAREIEKLPSVQPEQDREFIKLTVRNSNGRPYYSIIYLEVDDNGVGHDFEGYSSYSLDVISDYLKKYFMPSAQPETCDTCKHGYFGDDCDNCCVGYPNRYERRTDGTD